jgi:hypothetical protein
MGVSIQYMRIHFVVPIILSAIFLCQFQTFAQNVGIGTTTPQAKLDVVNSFRVGGLNNYFSYDSSGRIIWANSFIYAPSAQALIRNAKTSVHYNNKQLEYRDSINNPVFYINWKTGNAFFAGKLGVGVTAPEAPLHLPAQIQEKIIFYGNSLLGNYGIGVESYQLRIHGDGAGEIAFGYGKANNFHETMRITPSGAVGINAEKQPLQATLDVRKLTNSINSVFSGSNFPSVFCYGYDDDAYLRGGNTNSKLILNDIPGGLVGIGVEPAVADYILDVNGPMRIRSGPGGSSAGIWLNKTNNSGVAGFIGMEDDSHIGFYGNVTGWKFSLNTASGAIKINGSEGDSAKVLQSNGSGSSPSWVVPTNALANSVFATTGSVAVTALNGGGAVDIPGLSQVVNVPGTAAKVIVTFDVYTKNNACFACGNSDAYIYVVVDGTTVSQNIYYLNNGNELQLSGSFLVQLTNGSHTIKLMGSCAGASMTFSCTGCGNAKRMVLQVINN